MKQEQTPPQKKWLSIEAPDGYSWWEYHDGHYSATLFESHQRGVEKKEVSVYFKGKLLDDDIFFSSLKGPREAANAYIEGHREDSKPKKVPSIFEQARRAISRAKNRKESEVAASLFHGITNSGKITREEESILEAFLVLKVAKFIRQPDVTTDLPRGYDSWFQIWASSEHLHREKQIKTTGGPRGYATSCFEEDMTTYLLDMDFVKARAMDEIAEFLPDSAEEVSRTLRGFTIAQQMYNGAQEKSPIEKKLSAMLRFYGNNDIRRN